MLKLCLVSVQSFRINRTSGTVFHFRRCFCFFSLRGQNFWNARPKCAAPAPGTLGPGFVVLAGGNGNGMHDKYHEQQEVCPRRPDELLYNEHRRHVTFDKHV